MIKQLDMGKFEEYISQFPVYEYRILDTKGIQVRERVRTICSQECERFGTTWACPPAVGSLEQCRDRISRYPQAVFFSSVAEVSDLMNMEEMLSTRHQHEKITEEIASFLREQGFSVFTLSTGVYIPPGKTLQASGKNAPLSGKPWSSGCGNCRRTANGIQSGRQYNIMVFHGIVPSGIKIKPSA